MSQKKRGLGRGLGALIPQGPAPEKPTDVFFAGAEESGNTNVLTTSAESAADPEEGGGARSGRRSASWDSAIAGGRLSINASSARSVTSAPEADAAWSGETIGAPGRDGAVDSATVRTPAFAVSEHDASDDPASAVLTDSGDRERSATVPSDRAADGDGLLPVPGARFAEVPLRAIRPNARQPRTVFDEGELDELVDSIREIGVLQPVVVRPHPEIAGGFELIMGERRWRAAEQAGLETIPAIVRQTENSQMLRDALLENLHRAALNPLEEAAAYRQLLDDFGCTHDELAARIARSRPQISNTLRLLRLPPLVQRRVASGVLSAGHARALLGLSDGAEIERLAQRIVSEGLSVRATEEIVTLMQSGDDESPRRRKPRAGQRVEAMDELSSRLSDRFETRVKVNLGKTKGRMTVEFASVEDLNRILEVMAPEDPGVLKPSE
ncbi:ParB/RepB/Spo0J family partition protein [Isoptericola sp. b408]|uniref:ParB/RepB/Spo0J family partition protein n=1 Tax=Isoptericola sp. b408 TaxID=3064653 RepID=UPI0027128B7B|nr:ParB/RepB/Spo0J family partition protein [Isoptericola sp. b408]MDO8150035.1 ParB/RepB/Spo0J family partition protein [Isoptericola sp. b408]